MKMFRVLLFLLLAFPALLSRGASPDQLVQSYFDDIAKGNWAAIAANMHRDELTRFREITLPVLQEGFPGAAETNDTSPDAVAINLFLDGDDADTIANESPGDYFARFLKWIMLLNPGMRESIAGTKVHVIGTVPEGEELHVLYRVSVDFGGTAFSQLNVMSLMKDEDDWKLKLSGEIENMGRMFQMTPSMSE